MNASLFIRSLEERMSGELKRKLSSTIGTINAKEVEGLLIRLTDLKTRYLAALLDLGKKPRGIHSNNWKNCSGCAWVWLK